MVAGLEAPFTGLYDNPAVTIRPKGTRARPVIAEYTERLAQIADVAVANQSTLVEWANVSGCTAGSQAEATGLAGRHPAIGCVGLSIRRLRLSLVPNEF